MFSNQIAVCMQKFGQIRAKSKNGLRFDIGRLCSDSPSINTRLCTLVGQLLTQLNYYFNVPITANMFLAIQSYTKNR